VTTTPPHVLELLRDGVPGDADRERVLDAALEAFLDFGIRRTSMGEIARRSGLSPATLYRRFPGKDHIVWAVGLREAVRLVERVDAEVDPTASAEEQIVALSVACMRELRANALLRRLLATEPEIVLPFLTIEGGAVLDLGRAYVAEVIRRLAERDGVTDLDTEQVAELLARLTLSMAFLPRTCIPFDDERALRAFARRHIAGVLGWSST
jgi:AcrR family transcriptional regulator